MKRTIRLTESELHQLIKETINEVLDGTRNGIINYLKAPSSWDGFSYKSERDSLIPAFKSGYAYGELTKAANMLEYYSSDITTLMDELPNDADNIGNVRFNPTAMAEMLKTVAGDMKENGLRESVLDPYTDAAKSAYNSVFGNKRKVRGEENPKFLQAIKNGYLSGQLKRAAKIIDKYYKKYPDHFNQFGFAGDELSSSLNTLADLLLKGGKLMLRKKGQFYKKANLDVQDSGPTERMPMSTYKSRGTGGHMIDYSNMNSGTGYSY